jgi:hypothetical protein
MSMVCVLVDEVGGGGCGYGVGCCWLLVVGKYKEV